MELKDRYFEAMFDGTSEAIVLATLEGRVLETNRAAVEFTGLARAAMLDQLVWEISGWAHDAAQREQLRSAMEAAATGARVTFAATHISSRGEAMTTDISVRRAPGVDGNAAFLIVEGHDVSARQAAQQALEESRDALVGRLAAQQARLAISADTLEETQALYRAVAETIVDGIVVIDHRGTIEWTNPAAATLFGHETADLVGKNVNVLMPSPYREEHDDYVRRYLNTDEARIIGIGREVRGLRKDGTQFPLYLAVGETKVHGVRKFTGIIRDLSTNKRLERMLQERQTLARIGELAAVVAHEVRNPLAAIRGVVEVIQTRFPEGAPDRKILGELLVRVDSLDHLVSDLLVYARPASPEFRRTSVLGLARETAPLVENEPRAAAVHFEVSGDDLELAVDEGQMGRAFLNLMRNAAQAMRHHGVVRVVGERLTDHYRVTIEDEGPGMPPEIVEKCLEPFFTTKTRGTGLGLPIAKRVVDEHGGTLTVTSVVGRGTRVVVDLPIERSSTELADPR